MSKVGSNKKSEKIRDEIKEIPLDQLASSHTQTRASTRPKAIEEYAEILKEGGSLDPALVFWDGEHYHLAAGFHRLEAYRLAGKDSMPCIVRQGTAWDAVEAGINDNHRHRGERLTLEDKRHNARLVLNMQPQKSDREVADLVRMSHVTIARIRRELESTGQIDQLESRVGRDGKERRCAKPANPSCSTEAHCERRSGCPQCGGEWENDGHGSRFCPDCKTEHPDNAAPSEAAIPDPKAIIARESRDSDEAPLTPDDFMKSQRYLAKVADLIDRAGKTDRPWREAAKKQCNDLSCSLGDAQRRIFGSADPPSTCGRRRSGPAESRLPCRDSATSAEQTQTAL